MAVGNWSVDEMNLSQWAWNISGQTISTAGFRGDSIVLAQRSGSIPVFNRSRETGEFSLSMWVLGTNNDGSIPATGTLRRTIFDTNLNNLIRVLTQDTRLLVFKFENANGTRIAEAQLTGSISVDTMMARQRGEYTATFALPNVFWHDAAKTSTSSAADATLPKTLPLTHLVGGTAPIDDAVIQVTGPITNPRVEDLETGNWVQYTGTVPAGQIWEVDAGAYTSKVNGSSVRAQTTHGGHPRFLYIPTRYGQTNTPTVRLTGTAGGTSTKLTVTSYRKYELP